LVSSGIGWETLHQLSIEASIYFEMLLSFILKDSIPSPLPCLLLTDKSFIHYGNQSNPSPLQVPTVSAAACAQPINVLSIPTPLIDLIN